MNRGGPLVIGLSVAMLLMGGCSDPAYDASTPQAALDSMCQMIVDGRPEMLGGMLHIEARDITFADGVTEASAIADVTKEAGEMLGQLYRVAGKLRERFPAEVQRELERAATGVGPARDDGADLIDRLLTDPLGLMDEQRQRLTVEDLGDGTAALLIDGKPAFGFGLQMRQVDGTWKVDLPIELLQRFRPNTREEWGVLANMMLSIENSLTAFETELDAGEFRSLQLASNRAGRLLGERVFVQAIIYRNMKRQAADQRGA